MKATKALPTEDRVQRMNDQQWLWYYLNLLEDEGEEEKKNKMRMDYLGWYINPEQAKRVMEHEKGNFDNEQNTNNLGPRVEIDPLNPNREIIYKDVRESNTFEDELNQALLGESGSFVTLPDSQSAGNPYESKDDFINRVLVLQNSELQNSGIDLNDIDFIETPDE